ncbi:UDP-N-acetylmuramoyl-L-alanyl-D-glutamate--2,6-diaminopimelate ligase [Candidatus Saganbacteria bacterium]|nr:UDP-N-acetylmuramoyl-L-alanyl-D-glutamate--2,6-diaminopimelate ligase [Candidatus Saganbacteria bacterium]
MFDDFQIKGLSYDSRKVKPGDVFVAIPGSNVDGYDFILQAIENGARAVVAEKDFPAPSHVQKLIVQNARQALAELSNRFYDYPSKKLKLIGVTGTNGKTTISYLIESILTTAGFKVGLIGTIETRIAGRPIESNLTTPESLELQALLSQMEKEGVTHVVMEVSSHSLAQYRVYGCGFDVAIYTNLTHDHLDFHKTMGQYLEEKKKLFRMLKPEGLAIVNIDDPYANEIISEVENEVIFYGIKEAKHELKSAKYSELDLQFKDYSFDLDQMRIKIDSLEIMTQLIGTYNVYNVLAAYQCGLSFNLSRDIIKNGIEKTVVSGRMERIENNKGIKIIVDFAHSPDALQKLLETLKPYAKGNLILVFGCPGDRDRDKRPIMGKIASDLADHVIVTTDDPHTEPPGQIISEILSGMTNDKFQMSNYEAIQDRRDAIEKALSIAKKGDILVIAGRGHEKFQDFSGKKVLIDDREVVRGFFRSDKVGKS